MQKVLYLGISLKVRLNTDEHLDENYWVKPQEGAGFRNYMFEVGAKYCSALCAIKK